jgi:uncharacterized protein YcfL
MKISKLLVLSLSSIMLALCHSGAQSITGDASVVLDASGSNAAVTCDTVLDTFNSRFLWIANDMHGCE